MMKKTLILIVVGILVLSGVGMAGVTSGVTLSSQKQLEMQESQNMEKLEFVYLRVYVNEIYGTVDDPQYRPLANVTVEIKGSLFGIFWEFVWGGLTKESGKTDDVEIANGLLYKVTVSKVGYHTYKCRPSQILMTGDQFEYHVYFTMAENGSPFVKQISQNKQQSNSQSFQQSSSVPSNQNTLNVISPAKWINAAKPSVYDGSLSGYVTDSLMNPMEGALVRVHFHGTYEEDYSDENGYYHVTNIPICYCLKNATCSKDGYKTEWVLLSITENTTYDFVLTPNHPPSAPTIAGPSTGKVGQELSFIFNAVDPDNDDVRYIIDWDDSKTDTTGLYPSGTDVTVRHTWTTQGAYTIIVKAQDEHGLYGPEASPQIPITITKNKDKAINILIQNFIQQHSTAGSQQSVSIPINQNVMSVVPSTGTTVVDKSYVSLLYTTHDPIYIHGNNDFTSENGVTGGSGTSNDPYIIEDWDINASSEDGVFIRNTSVFFEIRDCYVHDGGINNDGIVFINVTNGVIKNNIITRNRNGIIFRTQKYGWEEDSSYNKIQQNTISDNIYDGIHFEHISDYYQKHSHNQIFLNNITGNTRGIFLIMSKENLIYCNNIISNSEFGVELYTCTGGGGNNKVFHNNFIENGGENGQASCTMDYNDWGDGYPSGGNFWSDYTGSDDNGDGIGDEPYMIFSYYENDYDWYPLMELYGNWTYSPFAKFIWTPTLPEPNETILFNASDSVDYDGNITFYEWDWDNNGTFDENYTSPTATHTFEELGYYPVTLRVTDNDNLTGFKTKIVRVGNQPPYEPSNPNPPDGAINVPLNICVNCTGDDPDGDLVLYNIYFENKTPPRQVLWNSSTALYCPPTLELNTTYYWKIVVWDIYGASTEGPIWNFTTRGNQPPDVPTITGPTRGKAGVKYQYNFSLSDPDHDAMYLRVDWGNGTLSPWQGSYNSDTKVKLSHTWDKKGIYTIRAQAKDIYDMESDWVVLIVKMPKDKAIIFNSLLLKLVEKFPILQKVIQRF